VVRDKTIGLPVFDQIIRYVGATSIHETTDDVPRTIQLGDGIELVLIEKALDEGAVDPLANSSVAPIEDVVDACAVG
jgi:hypothetical protein